MGPGFDKSVRFEGLVTQGLLVRRGQIRMSIAQMKRVVNDEAP